MIFQRLVIFLPFLDCVGKKLHAARTVPIFLRGIANRKRIRSHKDEDEGDVGHFHC